MRFLFIVLAVFALFTACTEEECTTTTDPRLRIRFLTRVQTTSTTGLTVFSQEDTTLRILSVEGVGNTSGSFVSDVIDTTERSIITASLSELVDSTSLIIKWDTATLVANSNENSVFTDTLMVRYVRQPYYVSEGCGFNYKFTNITLAKETFTTSPDQQILTVTVANSTADETLQPNINILFNFRTE